MNETLILKQEIQRNRNSFRKSVANLQIPSPPKHNKYCHHLMSPYSGGDVISEKELYHRRNYIQEMQTYVDKQRKLSDVEKNKLQAQYNKVYRLIFYYVYSQI